MEVFAQKKEAFTPQIIIKQPSNTPQISLTSRLTNPPSRLSYTWNNAPRPRLFAL